MFERGKNTQYVIWECSIEKMADSRSTRSDLGSFYLAKATGQPIFIRDYLSRASKKAHISIRAAILNIKPESIMELKRLNREYGTDSQNMSGKTNQQDLEGALACLETFYYAFNNGDLNTLRKVWYDNELIQLNNPLGGIKRGTTPVMEVYDKIFKGHARVRVKFTDIIYYATDDMVVFAGTEIGDFQAISGTIALKIRTTRIFCFSDNRKSWFQLHHHGSIDDSALLLQYQNAVNK